MNVSTHSAQSPEHSVHSADAERRALIAFAAAIALAAVHQYLFFGRPPGVSVPLFVLLFYGYMLRFSRIDPGRITRFGWFLFAVIMLLALTYGLFANPLFLALNTLALPPLIALHWAYLAGAPPKDWCDPALIVRALDHLAPRTLRRLPTPFRILRRLIVRRLGEGRMLVFGKVLLGLLLSVPLLAIVISLLASADVLFHHVLGSVPEWFRGIAWDEGMRRALWIAVLGPLLFGYLWGFVDRQPNRRTPSAQVGGGTAGSAAGGDATGGLGGEPGVGSGGKPAGGDATGGFGNEPEGGPAGGRGEATCGGESGRRTGKTDGGSVGVLRPSAAAGASFRADPIVVATVLTLVNAVYVLFVAVQFSYLFGAWSEGLPDGFTYAEYARSGFFELVAVSVINFGLLAGALAFGGRGGSAALHRANRTLLYLLTGCTGMMLYSAFSRLMLYEEAYGYTYIRFLAHAFMLFLAVLLVIAGLKIAVPRIPLAKCCIVCGLVAYTAVNYAGMDAFIAAKNIERYYATGKIDEAYLLRLSPDAVPQLVRFSEEAYPALRPALADKRRAWSEDKRAWPSFSWSRYRAMRALESLAAEP
jgi:hypothetical protein